MIALYAATVAQLREAAIPGTITLAEEIGKVVRRARLEEDNPVETIREAIGGFLIFRGKIGDVERRTEAGFAKGDAMVDGIDEYAGQQLQLSFQNEHLAARIDGEFRVTVPDLLAVLDVDTGEPITTEGAALWLPGRHHRHSLCRKMAHRKRSRTRRTRILRLRHRIRAGGRQIRSDLMRLLYEENIEDIALGAAVLGTGGGGDPYVGKLMAREAIRQYGPVELYSLDELDDDDLIVPSAGMGAPIVHCGKTCPPVHDMIRAFQALGKYSGREPRGTMSIEAGGLNSIMPIYVAARLRIPMVDCDGMGRAFPEIQMTIFTAYGITASPFAMSDERGNVLLMDTVNNKWVETFARSCVVHMGAEGMIALYSATVKQTERSRHSRHYQLCGGNRQDRAQRAQKRSQSGGCGAQVRRRIPGFPRQNHRCRSPY